MPSASCRTPGRFRGRTRVQACESLEQRLLMAFSADVNFQPSGAPVPAGYRADSGSAFGSRGGGLSYGWNANNSAHARDRNSPLSPDQRYDTLTHLQKPSNPDARWRLAVPNGSYVVTVVSGDPTATDSFYHLDVEGVTAVRGQPTTGNRWLTGTVRVTVSDGRLTVSNGSSARNNKVNFIRVRDTPVVTVTATDASASEPGTNTGTFQFSRTGSTELALTVSFTMGGTATPGEDYDAPAGTVTFAAGSSTASLTLTPKDDAAVETGETAVLTVAAGTLYNRGSTTASRTATVNIADDDVATPANRPPATPVILEPVSEGVVVSGADVHMVTDLFADPDAGQAHLSTDWQILTAGGEVVWQNMGATGEPRIHTHFGDGQFVNSRAGQSDLLPDTNYTLRVRHRDGSGDATTNTSAWAQRGFRTAAVVRPIPNAPDWTADQPGYRVEALPVSFAAGEGEFRLPVNIAFVPPAIRGDQPGDPFFYVTELYGSIRVVTNDLTVRTYATGLLNYNPEGPISGSGENGLTGLLVEPATGDVFASMLYDDPTDGTTQTVPKVTRLRSTDGGLTASGSTDVLVMRGEFQGQSHQVSNISIGPADGKLYVHMGDGISTPQTGLDLNSFRGKVLRMNLDGTPVTTNPFYNAADGINARDYVFAYGFRNPFGGAWRDADGQHYQVENGPSTDRITKVRAGVSYGWDGTDASMQVNALTTWSPATAPVNMTFVQNSHFGGSLFPADKQGHLFTSDSGPTYATGPQATSKRITEYVLGDAQPNGNLAAPRRSLVRYTGDGKATVAALAAGPDGLYFSDLYEDDPVNGAFQPTARGANILRVRYVGAADFTTSARAGTAPHAVSFTDASTVPEPAAWFWDFGDGNTSTARNPTHTYAAGGVYDVTLRVTGATGTVEQRKPALIRVGAPAGNGLLATYFDNIDLTGPLVARTDPTVDFDWGGGSPSTSIGADSFSARWVGRVTPRFSETYNFHTISDDGIRLWVNGQLVIDNWTDHAPTENTGTVALSAGVEYDLRLEFYENGGGAVARLLWSSISQAREAVPQSRLLAV